MPAMFQSPDCGTNRMYVFRPLQSKSLKFKVKAGANVNLCLSPSPSEVTHQQYEIFLGGWGGGESAIRRNKQDDVQKVQTPNILNKNEFRGFWIVITDHAIKVGKEGQGTPFLVHSDGAGSIRVSYYGYCTAYGSTGQWSFADDTSAHASRPSGPSSALNMNSVVDAINKVVVHPKATAPPPVVYHYLTASPHPPAPSYPNPGYPSYPNPGYPSGGYPLVAPQPTPCYPQVYPTISQPPAPTAPVDSGRGLRWVPCRSVSMCPAPVIGTHEKPVSYVALAYHEGGLIPGAVYASNPEVCIIPFGGKAFHKGDFFLLSNTANVELVWEKESNGAVPLGAVQGGYSEKKEPLYVGRLSHFFKNYCGKVHPRNENCYAPYEGKETSSWNYEVLCMKTVPMSILGP